MGSYFFKLVINISISNLAILLLGVNCTQPRVENSSIPTIDIIPNNSNVQKVNLSSIAVSIDYCILETDKKCLIANKNIYSSGNYFVYISRNEVWGESVNNAPYKRF